jgi:hypothetical protein
MRLLILSILGAALAFAQLPTQAVHDGFYFPRPPSSGSSTPAMGTTQLVIDAADEAAGAMVTCPKTGNITKVGWGTRTVTTGATLDVRLETLTSGLPSGTLWGTTTNASQVVANGDDNVGFLTTLTAAASCTQGQLIGVVIKNPNTSFGNMQISCFGDDLDWHVPTSLIFTGTWARSTACAPNLYFEYDDGTYAASPGAWAIKDTITTNTISTSTTPDVIGARFQLPFPAKVHGGWFWCDMDGSAKFMVVTDAYHQGNQTGIVASITVGVDDDAINSAGVQQRLFDTSVDLVANTNYRLVMEPTSGTSLACYDYNVTSLAAMNATPGGANFHLSTAKDPTGDGSWTNYNSGTFRKPFMGLILAGFGASTTFGY